MLRCAPSSSCLGELGTSSTRKVGVSSRLFHRARHTFRTSPNPNMLAAQNSIAVRPAVASRVRRVGARSVTVMAGPRIKVHPWHQ